MGLQSIGTLAFASQVLNAVPSPHLSQEQIYVLQATSVQSMLKPLNPKTLKLNRFITLLHLLVFVGIWWYLLVRVLLAYRF